MARQPSVMKHQFSEVPRAEISRSSFNRSHGWKGTIEGGDLIPFYADEGYPSDSHTVRCNIFARMATPLHPFMDNIRVATFFFAVPIRQIWDNWQRFNGEQLSPSDTTEFTMPTVTAPSGGWPELSLADHLGIPTKIDNLKHRVCWHRAYNWIYDQWFRDQNLQTPPVLNRGDGPDNPSDYKVLKRGKRHDYFSSSLPFPQKGPDVPLLFEGSVPVTGLGADVNSRTFAPAKNVKMADGSTVSVTQGWASGSEVLFLQDNAGNNTPELIADLSQSTGNTIGGFREAVQIQRLFERDARSGTRYTEILKAHFGVTSPDARLQRPEYLGGGVSAVTVTPVAQTSETLQTGGSTPQGNLAAFATFSVNGHGFTKSFTEHCVILGLMSINADLNYQYGLNRMFSRETRFDFMWPVLARLGEQAVLNQEIWADGTNADQEVWGYQGRYDDLRYKPSIITGRFRSNAAQPLDSWHLAEKQETRPALNAAWIEDPSGETIKRVVAVQNEPQFICDAFFSMRTARALPTFGVPGMVDHF